MNTVFFRRIIISSYFLCSAKFYKILFRKVIELLNLCRYSAAYPTIGLICRGCDSQPPLYPPLFGRSCRFVAALTIGAKCSIMQALQRTENPDKRERDLRRAGSQFPLNYRDITNLRGLLTHCHVLVLEPYFLDVRLCCYNERCHLQIYPTRDLLARRQLAEGSSFRLQMQAVTRCAAHEPLFLQQCTDRRQI